MSSGSDSSEESKDNKMNDNTANPPSATAGPSGEITGPIAGPEIGRIQIKVPPFWKINPALWFCQLEAQFHTTRTTSDRSKYYAVVGAIESTILNQVSDLVLHPPNNDMYNTLKARLLDVFADSEQSRLKKLLGEIEIGDQKPSFLLREMRNLADNSITTDLLKTLWLKNLPPNIQAILSISSEDVDRLAVMADKIFETSSHAEIQKISSRPSNNGNMDSKVLELSKQLSELKSRFDRERPDYRQSHKSRSRSRSQTPSNRSSSHVKDSGKLCWYHNRWGEKATKCVGDCAFKSASLN